MQSWFDRLAMGLHAEFTRRIKTQTVLAPRGMGREPASGQITIAKTGGRRSHAKRLPDQIIHRAA